MKKIDPVRVPLFPAMPMLLFSLTVFLRGVFSCCQLGVFCKCPLGAYFP